MNTSSFGKKSLIVLSLLTVGLATGCDAYKPGGSRSADDAIVLAIKLRNECTPIGIGIEGVHGGSMQKSEIFRCSDGTLGFIPHGLGL